MLRVAYIVIVKDVTPKTYHAVHRNAECFCLVAGVSDVNMGRKYVRKLLDHEYTVINLCGEFSDATAEALQAEAGDDVKVRNARLSFDELLKFNLMERMRYLGLIIKLPGVEKAHEVVMRSPSGDTRVIFVKDIRQARNAGRRLIQKRVDMIELSTWFDRLRMDSIVDATEDAVPVATCGDLDMRELED